MNINLKYFYSTVENGNMNTAVRFYKEGMSREAIRDDFTRRRIYFGRQNNFDGLKILTPIQKAFPNLQGKTEEEKQVLLEKYYAKYPDGTYVRITKDMIDGYSDLYDVDIYSDILMIGKELPGIALAYPVADCPVVFVEDIKNQVVAMAHCGGEYIDRELPAQIVEAIREETDARCDDLRVFVGPHAQQESFTYDRVPTWIHQLNLWSGAIVEKRGYYHIDMAMAIRNQLNSHGIDDWNITVSNLDTITDPRFYSNNQARFSLEKAGRFYVGCVYNKEKVLEKSMYL